MIQLEKLYQAADSFLTEPVQPDWGAFADAFKSVFDADLVIYKPILAEDGSGETIDLQFIVTTQPETMKIYSEKRMFEMHPVSEAGLAPLEPLRRTDIFDDHTFRSLGPLADFMISMNMFYVMVVPAFMSDGSLLRLYVWRSEKQGDYSDTEKQRLTLLMRYIRTIVESQNFEIQKPDSDVAIFAQKYNLTDAQSEILSALLEGHSPKQIAENTNRTYGTVRWHVQNILEKCQVKSQKNLLHQFYALIKN